MAKNYSKNWNFSKEEFINACESSSSIKEAGGKLGVSIWHISQYREFRRIALQFDYSLIALQERQKQARKNAALERNRNRSEQTPLSEILIEHYTGKIQASSLKKRLLYNGILEEKCVKCGLGNNWQGQFITLQLDHINGSCNDNRLENLRILCPNCHSQTLTYAGRNRSKNSLCVECKAPVSGKKFCFPCLSIRESAAKDNNIRTTSANFYPKTTGVYPSDAELKVLVLEKPLSAIAAEVGVSLQAVSNFLKRRNIEFPGAVYWQKKNRRIGKIKTKIVYPPLEDLKELVMNKPLTQVAKDLGVADTTLALYCRRRNIQYRTSSFWNKQRFNK